MTISIQPYEASDWHTLWPILRATFARGDTYTFPADAAEDEVRHAWTTEPNAAFVARDDTARVIGSYYIKANQPGNGSHVCNCGYVVSQAARNKGVATRMCEHSQSTAIALGFLAMQFNFVVATNTAAIRLWQRLGFDIVGTLPGAFRHPEAGVVDVHVMYKWLAD